MSLTTDQWQQVISALYIARDEYRRCAASVVSDPRDAACPDCLGLAKQFEEQAKDAQQLAEIIEQSE